MVGTKLALLASVLLLATLSTAFQDEEEDPLDDLQYAEADAGGGFDGMAAEYGVDMYGESTESASGVVIAIDFGTGMCVSRAA